MKRNVLYHILGWGIFILYETGLFLLFEPLERTIVMLWYYPVYIFQFYFNVLVIYKRIDKPIRLSGLAVLIIQWLVFAGILWLVGVAVHHVPIEKAIRNAHKIDISNVLWRSGYFTILATTFWAVRQHIRNLKKSAQLQQKLLQAQNAYLRAQINPHLLFNSLNFIYHGILNKREQTADAVALLSELMQYAASNESGDSKALLLTEIEQVEKFMELYQMRAGTRLDIISAIDRTGITDLHRVPPLLLVNFVENMFTHGDDAETYKISLRFQKGYLLFCTQNGRLPETGKPGNRTGIANARTRLENLYPKNEYDLNITENKTQFIVMLRLKL